MTGEEFVSARECNNFQLRFNQILGLFSQEHESATAKNVHYFLTRLAFFVLLAMNTFLQALYLGTVTNVQV